MIDWDASLPLVLEILRSADRSQSVDGLLPVLSSSIGQRVSYDSLKAALKQRGYPPPSQMVGGGYRAAEPVKPSTSEPDFAALVKAARKGVTFAELCDSLDLSPGKCRALIERAKDDGYRVDVTGDVVAWKGPEHDPDDDVPIEIKPIDKWMRFAVIGDTHFGSKYCMRKQMQDFLRYAKEERGCDTVIHAGDMTEGTDPKVRYELSHHNFDEQVQDAIDWLPRDMRFHCIYGNHDAWHARENGMDVGRAMEDKFRLAGFKHMKFHGGMKASLVLNGWLRIGMQHPAGGTAYSKSYKAQIFSRDMPSNTGRKPHIQLFGHRHANVHFVDRGMHLIDVPCWLGQGSNYSKRLHGAPTIGGIILEVGQLDNGIVRAFRYEPVLYYEGEQVDAIETGSLEHEYFEPAHVKRQCVYGRCA